MSPQFEWWAPHFQNQQTAPDDGGGTVGAADGGIRGTIEGGAGGGAGGGERNVRGVESHFLDTAQSTAVYH